MPFTDEFKKIRQNFRSKYHDMARADTLLFRKALKEKIPTFQGRARRIKRQKRENVQYDFL